MGLLKNPSLATLNPPLSVILRESLALCHPEPFAVCHSESFASCHSKQSEESQPAQDKLREESKGWAQDKLREGFQVATALPRNDIAQDKLRDRRILVLNKVKDLGSG